MGKELLKQALQETRDRIRFYDERRKPETLTGGGTAVENEANKRALELIDAALKALAK
jgi:hypothetical protein